MYPARRKPRALAAATCCLLASCCAVAAAASSPAAATPPPFRLSLGMNIDPANAAYGDPAAAALAAVGASWARVEYKDGAPAGAPPSPSNVTFYRAKASSLVAGGVQVLMILDYSSLPGRPSPTASNASWASFSSAFGSRCQAVAAAMGSVVAAYEVWNEPDLTHVGNVPAQHYGPLLQAAYKGIKAAAPAAVVVMGGLASGNPAYVADARAASGGVLYADKVGLHPYGQRPTANWPTPTWGFGVLTTLMQRYYAVEPKELWITEVGTNVGGAVEAAFPAHTFAAVADDGAPAMCTHVFWFCWSDGMVDGFGVVDTAGAPKPSYHSYQAFAKGQ